VAQPFSTTNGDKSTDVICKHISPNSKDDPVLNKALSKSAILFIGALPSFDA
jgi:hypothetical protein